MSYDRTKALALSMTARLGTLVHPKGDGRVEIPRALVRLMEWKDKQVITIVRSTGCLDLSDRARVGEHVIGHVTISTERARIPMSMLRAAEMTGYRTLVISASLTPPSLSVQPWIIDRQDELRQIIDCAGPEIRDRLYSILVDARPVLLPEVANVEPEPIKFQADEQTSLDRAQLFLPEFGSPTVVRILGSPFVFQSHWVALDNGGAIIPHPSSECQLCNNRAPDKMYLVPVIRKKNGTSEPGHLLIREEIRAKIGRVIAGANPTLFDVIFFYKPFAEGSFDVYRNPPEPMLEDVLERAREACENPDEFISDTFPIPKGSLTLARMPMTLVPAHFASGFMPYNLGK
jgi:hypothetical protein